MLGKFILTIALFACSFCAKSQIVADPATGQIDMRTIANESLDANQILPTQPLKLVFPVYNLNQVNTIPAASCQLKINIGSNLIIDPAFSLNESTVKDYFSFSSVLVGGSLIITGQQIAPIPNDFAKEAEFRLLPKSVGQADISVNFEIKNQGPVNGVTDEDPQNNFASLQYIIVKEVVPVKFLKLRLSKTNCNIGVLFQVENEIDVKKYEIEASTNSVQFQMVASKTATKANQYNVTFSAAQFLNATTLYIRVKSVDLDGKVLYSEVQTIAGDCKEMNIGAILLYPNPIKGAQTLSVKKTSGEPFDGDYKVQLFSMAGNLLYEKDLLLVNRTQFTLDPFQLRNKGMHFVKLFEKKNATTFYVKFEVL